LPVLLDVLLDVPLEPLEALEPLDVPKLQAENAMTEVIVIAATIITTDLILLVFIVFISLPFFYK
jgi:hypothetical protein